MSFARPVLAPRSRLASGQRDHDVEIQQAAPAVSGTRYPVETWTTLVALEWMSRTDVSAIERFAANQPTASADTQWEMAFRDDMDPDVLNVPKARRLVYRGRVYNIIAATVIGRKHGIELLTVAKVDG